MTSLFLLLVRLKRLVPEKYCLFTFLVALQCKMKLALCELRVFENEAKNLVICSLQSNEISNDIGLEKA